MGKPLYYEVPVNSPKYKRLYSWWARMRESANPVHLESRAKAYRKSNVTLCKDWYYDFTAFADYCLANGYADDKHIHLKPGCKEYGPGNIEFKDYRYCPRISYAEYDGVTKSAYAWCKELGISYYKVNYQIYHGKSAKEAIEYVKSQTAEGGATNSTDERTTG